MASTGFAVIFVVLGSFMDYNSCVPVREYPPVDTLSILTGLGAMLFCYGGHSAFPTIQHDMRKPSDFKKSSCLGFLSKKFMF